MNALRLLAAGWMVVALTAGARAEKKEEKKDNAKLLLGTWEIEGAPDMVGASTVVEFGKEGKLKVTFRRRGGDEVREGTYTVDGDRLTVTARKDGDKEVKLLVTIKKISDTEMVTEDERGYTEEFKRKK
jgi:uncharacterized protein (TIGR03066 family)